MTTSLLRPQMKTWPSWRKPRSPVRRNGPANGVARALGVLPVAAHDARARRCGSRPRCPRAAACRSSRRPARRRAPRARGTPCRTRRGARRPRRPRDDARPAPFSQSVGPCDAQRLHPLVELGERRWRATTRPCRTTGGAPPCLKPMLREGARRRPRASRGGWARRRSRPRASVDRSSPSRSAGLMRFTQSAYAKFGAYAMVPLCRVNAWSHVTGRLRKSSAGRKCTGTRVIERRQHEADEPHVVVERQPRHARRPPAPCAARRP